MIKYIPCKTITQEWEQQQKLHILKKTKMKFTIGGAYWTMYFRKNETSRAIEKMCG